MLDTGHPILWATRALVLALTDDRRVLTTVASGRLRHLGRPHVHLIEQVPPPARLITERVFPGLRAGGVFLDGTTHGREVAAMAAKRIAVVGPGAPPPPIEPAIQALTPGTALLVVGSHQPVRVRAVPFDQRVEPLRAVEIEWLTSRQTALERVLDKELKLPRSYWDGEPITAVSIAALIRSAADPL